jgi:hypothetical protein
MAAQERGAQELARQQRELDEALCRRNDEARQQQRARASRAAEEEAVRARERDLEKEKERKDAAKKRESDRQNLRNFIKQQRQHKKWSGADTVPMEILADAARPGRTDAQIGDQTDASLASFCLSPSLSPQHSRSGSDVLADVTPNGQITPKSPQKSPQLLPNGNADNGPPTPAGENGTPAESDRADRSLRQSTEDPPDVVATLREGLALGQSPAEIEEPAPPAAPPGSLPAWLRNAKGPDGRPLEYELRDRGFQWSANDSMVFRIETLRTYLEFELGLPDFVAAYRHLVEAVDGALAPADLEGAVSEKALAYLPLLHQLMVCEDECFSS